MKGTRMDVIMESFVKVIMVAAIILFISLGAYTVYVLGGVIGFWHVNPCFTYATCVIMKKG